MERSLSKRQAFTCSTAVTTPAPFAVWPFSASFARAWRTTNLNCGSNPEIDLETGRVAKVEAVPRWLNDDGPSRMSSSYSNWPSSQV